VPQTLSLTNITDTAAVTRGSTALNDSDPCGPPHFRLVRFFQYCGRGQARTSLQIGRLCRSDAFTDRPSLQIGRLYKSDTCADRTFLQIGRLYKSDESNDQLERKAAQIYLERWLSFVLLSACLSDYLPVYICLFTSQYISACQCTRCMPAYIHIYIG